MSQSYDTGDVLYKVVLPVWIVILAAELLLEVLEWLKL